MIHQIQCSVPLDEQWRQWINARLDKQAEELNELFKVSAQNARIKIPSIIVRLRQILASKLTHEALDHELEDGERIALSPYLHELFDEHQMKMRELAEECLNAFTHSYPALIDCSLQVVDADGNENEAKISELSQILNDYKGAVSDEPILADVDKVAAAYSTIADEQERANIMLQDFDIMLDYLKWEFNFPNCPTSKPLNDRFVELRDLIDDCCENDTLYQCTAQIAEAISIFLAFETSALMTFVRKNCYLIWLHALTDSSLEFMRLADKETFRFDNPADPNMELNLYSDADVITGGKFKDATTVIQQWHRDMMDGEFPNPDLERLWDILHQRHSLYDIADGFWQKMLMIATGMYHFDEYKLGEDGQSCSMGNRTANDLSCPKFIVVPANGNRPAFTLLTGDEDFETLTLDIYAFDSQPLSQDSLNGIVTYLRDALNISIEPKGDWRVGENDALEAMLTDFDAMRKRGAWNKFNKLRK